MRRILVVVLAGTLLLGTAYAQQPSTEDMVKQLDPATTVSPRPGLREAPWSSKGLTEEGTDTSMPSMNLNIPFDYNSDKLSPDGIITLRRLGAALKDPRLANYRFKVAGHTDAKGTAEYNRKLSERRAQSVRDYLVFQYDLEPNRLETAGYGFTQLVDPSHPEDGINRRVQVINLVGKQ